MKRFTQCLATFLLSVIAGLTVAATCDYLIPAESWCDAACARWQMAGCPEGNDACTNGDCVSCLVACESWPNRYPTGPCVADPPIGAGSMQTCAEVRAACSPSE